MAGLLCLALTLGLLPSGLVLPARAAHWADPYGQKLVEWGVMRGDISGNLNLDRPITRAELVTMINRAYGYTRKAGTPFTDVPSSKWYADDIDIAYNAGYFKGVSSTAASPETSVTREQAAVFLARNLMLQETVGETLGFSDTRTLSEWSRGLIGAAVQEGVLNGYSDGSFKPGNNITRGEVAAMLVRAIGTPVNEEGDHTLGHVYGNVTLNTSNVTLRDTTIAGNLYLTGGIDLGHVLLENVTVLGQIIVSGAGESISGQESVTLRNVEAEELVLDSLRSPFVTVKAQGVTDIPLVTVRTNAYVDDSSWEGYGLSRIELRGDPGAKLQLAGSIKEVMNFTPASDLQFVKGSAEKVTVDEDAVASKLLVDKNTRVDELNLDVGTTVSGAGDIGNLNVGSTGSVVEQLPDQIVIRPGIDADIDGETIGSAGAAELSAEPRLMAGYPYMKNIAPTQADGVFSGSKPGTIYWAISAVADGSVSEEDLIENPTYGGNIFQKQAGSIDAASAKTEYISKVQQLQPDGTYYVSAILVDGRGKHSPLKVMSFATPDDKEPAFVKNPTMTKVTTDVAQTTVMANKDCLLYWALLPTGAQAPTPQEFKTGALGGNYGYGSLSVVKNAEISITVNRQKLREKTTYDLFLWLTDHNGAKSMPAPFKLTFTTPDETPPVVTAPVQTGWYDNRADVTFSMNEAPATLHWAIVAEGNRSFISEGTDLSDLRTKIKVESGTGAIANGAATVATAYADIMFTINGLNTADTNTNNYTLYYVGKDAAGNYSEKVDSISIQTLDTTPPTVVDPPQFTVYNGNNTNEPLADTGVKLVFSEQIKGGPNAKETFLELYNRAADASLTGEAKTAAQNALAKALSDCIQLYQVPRTGDAVLLNPPDGYTSDANAVLDFRNAIVTYENGKLVVFLPGDGDKESTAIRLESGATYYFEFDDVYDNAFNANGLMGDPNGYYRMKNFTTVYAQVNLTENDDYVRIPANETLTASGFANLRLDMCFEVNAKSTNKVPETERWDLIMRSNTWIAIDLYRQTFDDKGQLLDTRGNVADKDASGNVTAETWEKLGSTDFMTPDAGKEYYNRGMGYAVLGNDSANGSYGVLKTDLKQGYTYRYGVHITALKGESEKTSTTVDPPTWSGTVQMKFAIIAGGSRAVSNVSQQANAVYDPDSEGDMGGNDVSIISQWNTRTGSEKEILLRRPYTDTRVPEFYTDFPKFTPTSGSVDMELRLTRGGTVYYLIAPADVVSPSVPNGNSIFNITKSTNGSTTDDGNDTNTADGIAAKKEAISKLSNGGALTYIPLNGSEREMFKEYIAFTEYEATSDTANDGKAATVYSVPTFDDIRTPANAGYDKISSIKYGSKVLGTAAESVLVTGLTAKTDYYVYFVFQGGGDPGRVVECYRFTTSEAKPPVITMNGDGYTALTINTTDPDDPSGNTPYVDGEIYYAIAVMSGGTGVGTLPAIFSTKYRWGSDGGPSSSTSSTAPEYTVLEAMSAKVTSGEFTGRTYFEAYGGIPNINLKGRVLQYIKEATGTGTGLGTAPIKQFGPVDGPSVPNFDFSGWMESDAAEYVVLAASKQKNADDDANTSYGFGAARGLYNPDREAPELRTGGWTAPNGSQIFSIPTFSGIYATRDSTDTDNLMNRPNWENTINRAACYYSGTLTIRFTKPLYQVIQGTTFEGKAVVAASKATGINENTMVRFTDLLTATDGTWDCVGTSTSAASTFTLSFDRIYNGCTISFPNEGYLRGSNPNGLSCTKVLTLTFRATATTADYEKGILQPIPQPGWVWSWE